MAFQVASLPYPLLDQSGLFWKHKSLARATLPWDLAFLSDFLSSSSSLWKLKVQFPETSALATVSIPTRMKETIC